MASRGRYRAERLRRRLAECPRSSAPESGWEEQYRWRVGLPSSNGGVQALKSGKSQPWGPESLQRLDQDLSGEVRWPADTGRAPLLRLPRGPEANTNLSGGCPGESLLSYGACRRARRIVDELSRAVSD